MRCAILLLPWQNIGRNTIETIYPNCNYLQKREEQNLYICTSYQIVNLATQKSLAA
jgi:hypothetical protein